MKASQIALAFFVAKIQSRASRASELVIGLCLVLSEVAAKLKLYGQIYDKF